MYKKLAIISTHPIQYYAPVFQLLAREIELIVFYTLGENEVHKFDMAFKKNIEWNIPLLEGYKFTFVENIAKTPGSHHFYGVNNPNLINQIKDYNPDILLVYGWAYKSHLQVIRYFKGKVPIYFRGDSTLLNSKFGFKSLLKKIFLKYVYNHITGAFYVGTNNKAYFKKYALNDDQLYFAPHAIDNDRFAEDRTTEADSLREKLGIGKKEILILFAGKLELNKNPELLLDAFIKLDLENTHLLLVGNGVLEESLKLKVKGLEESMSEIRTQRPEESELIFKSLENKNDIKLNTLRRAQDDEREKDQDDNIKRKIHFIDFQNQTEIPVVYQACDLFCLPSKSETWGLAVNEAMACGKAILVSDRVGCATDLVQKNQNGAIFESGNLNDLIQKLEQLCVSRTQLKLFGKQSFKIINNWSFNEQVKCILNTIKK